MAGDFNTQLTTTSGVSVGMQTWCDRIMLETAKPKLVHAQGAVKKNIPKNSGKIAQWRRWTPLPLLIEPLSEGVVPDGQDILEEQVLAYVYQYGGYVTTSDLFDLTHMDSNNRELVGMVADQGARSVDAVIRNAMAETSTTQHAGSATAIYDIKASDKMDSTEVRKMVRTLKNNLAPMFTDGGGRPYYLGIVGPDTEYDIMDDETWLDVAKYSDKTKIYDGELGKLFGVRFLMTTEGLKYQNAELVADKLELTISGATGAVVTVTDAVTVAEAAALEDRMVRIFNTSGASVGRFTISGATATSGATLATITLTEAPTVAAGDKLVANEYGYNGNDVYCTFVFGKGAYAVADIAGSGGLRTIIKTPKDIGGPLEQFGTVGWKVDAMAVTILQELWLGKILHGVTA